jgi:peptidoglycan/LPS O-acetylase OafA/YrhL
VPFELIFAALLLLSLLVDGRPRALAWTQPLQLFGYISYGLYLYHKLIFVLADDVLKRLGFFKTWSTAEWTLRFVVDFALSVLIAYLSRRYFEEFFLSLKTRLAPSRKRPDAGMIAEPVAQ